MSPLLKSLQSAARMAVEHGNTVANINIAKWAETYGNVSTEDVRKAFDTALARASLTACPSGEFDGK